jgi:hypothetical protein
MARILHLYSGTITQKHVYQNVLTITPMLKPGLLIGYVWKGAWIHQLFTMRITSLKCVGFLVIVQQVIMDRMIHNSAWRDVLMGRMDLMMDLSWFVWTSAHHLQSVMFPQENLYA